MTMSWPVRLQNATGQAADCVGSGAEPGHGARSSCAPSSPWARGATTAKAIARTVPIHPVVFIDTCRDYGCLDFPVKLLHKQLTAGYCPMAGAMQIVQANGTGGAVTA